MAGRGGDTDSGVESRTAVFTASPNSHASAKSSSQKQSNRKPMPAAQRRANRKRAKKSAQAAKSLVPMGGAPSQSAVYLDASATDTTDPVTAQDNLAPGTTTKVNLGKNRLATGFAAQQPAGINDSTPPNEGSDDTPIEISSDESMSDSDEGGMIVVNINQELSEDGEVLSGTETNTKTNGLPTLPPPPPPDDAAAPPPPSFPAMKLEELNPEQLEQQIKYTLYHLDRDQIDPNRPVTCLACLKPGHMAVSCAESNCTRCSQNGHSSKRCPDMARCSRCRQQGHDATDCNSDMRITTVPCDFCGILSHVEQDCPQRFFARADLRSTDGGPVRLWISCCICASKSHLVGDCPDADRTAASRWSLRALAPGQYVNMSLEAGIKGRESEAENRGMRPVGLQIKGRADIRHPHGDGGGSSSDADDAFLKPSVRRSQAPNFRFGRVGNDRDQPPRFEGRSGQGSAPHDRSTWYGTDSFGRRRSRSPMRASNGDQWRPVSHHDLSPRGFDGRQQYRPRSPPRGGPSVDSYRPNPHLPPKPNHIASSSQQQPAGRAQATTSLPTRKGSNPNLQASRAPVDPASGAAPRPNPFDAKGGKKKKKKNKQKS